MKRLVITGLACPPQPWKDWLGDRPGQQFVPIREVFTHTSSCDPREMSRYITRRIEEYDPDSILCHDMGVPLTLLSLLRLNRKGICRNARVTLFNGAFRKINLLKATHPFRVQFMTDKKAIQILENQGGIVDRELVPHLPKIRAMYRLIILYGMTERVGSLVGLDGLVGFGDRSSLTTPIQIIASRNDPFIPFDSILQLKSDLNPKCFTELDYGHFPYTVDPGKVLPLIDDFESKFRAPNGKEQLLRTPPPSRTLW